MVFYVDQMTIVLNFGRGQISRQVRVYHSSTFPNTQEREKLYINCEMVLFVGQVTGEPVTWGLEKL